MTVMTHANPFKTLRTAALIAMAGMMTATYAMSDSRHDQRPHSRDDHKNTEQQAIRDVVARLRHKIGAMLAIFFALAWTGLNLMF